METVERPLDSFASSKVLVEQYRAAQCGRLLALLHMLEPLGDARRQIVGGFQEACASRIQLVSLNKRDGRAPRYVLSNAQGGFKTRFTKLLSEKLSIVHAFEPFEGISTSVDDILEYDDYVDEKLCTSECMCFFRQLHRELCHHVQVAPVTSAAFTLSLQGKRLVLTT